MKTKMSCMILLIWITNTGLAQTMGLDSVDLFFGRKYLPSEAYSYKFVKLFRMMDLGDNTSGINHFITTNVSEGKITLNGVINTKQGSNYTLKANIEATDGIFSIAQQSRINTNFSLDFSYNRLIKMGSELSFYNDDFQKLLNSTNILSLSNELQSIDDKLKQLKSDKNRKNKSKLKPQLATLNKKRDTLIEDQLSNLDQLKFTRIKYKTLQGSILAENNYFNLFNSSFIDLDSQLVRHSNFNISAKVQLNSYYWHQPHKRTHSYYWLAGVQFSYQDNFSDLDRLELTDEEVYSDSVTRRTISKNIIAYRGDYETKILGGRVYGDFYVFDSKNIMAIHIYPEIRIKQHQNAVVNFGLGFYFAFQSVKEEEKEEVKVSKINAEVFYQLNDLTNTYNSPLSTFKRGEVGIRLSFPITFIKP